MFSSGALWKRHTLWRLAAVDQGVDVLRAARIEVDVPLADRRLLEEQAGGEQRLADLHRQRPVVAGEATRQLRNLRVVAAPLAHAGEPLQDPPRDPSRWVGVLVRARRRAARAEHD